MAGTGHRVVSPAEIAGQGIHLVLVMNPVYTEEIAGMVRKQGVEAEVVTAVWGLESAYGAFRGTTPVIEALATLAYDGRRGRFFQSQLIAALKIVQSGDVRPRDMTGSWAGAMGHTQFAEYIGARGPNVQTNAACASGTQAVGVARDWIQTGRCRRAGRHGDPVAIEDARLGPPVAGRCAARAGIAVPLGLEDVVFIDQVNEDAVVGGQIGQAAPAAILVIAVGLAAVALAARASR